ncbi:hypothetical protein AVEN_227707-1 [Araneus ventricosus]|uniref:Uncharacterized protein n=1 Tax=Araneus ventricosus TaxID=182803 RepID=A0A4Y2M2E7_ARAVE|nr:hypothetical protein AVEN_227707-1 [Araneus ventricosus]
MTAGIVRIVRKLPSSPNTFGRATLSKKAPAVGVKSSTLNERGWKFQSDILERFGRLSSFAGRDAWDGPVSVELMVWFLGAISDDGSYPAKTGRGSSHELLVMGTIIRGPQCLMKSWRPVIQCRPDY